MVSRFLVQNVMEKVLNKNTDRREFIMPKVNIEVGQVIYVNERGFYESKPNLTEYKVSKVNGSSFYAYRTDADTKHESRFDRKTLICKTGYGYTKTAYLIEKEYWDMIELEDERKELSMTIQQAVKGLNVDTLRKIQELIKTSA
jgi:hypothetical protein